MPFRYGIVDAHPSSGAECCTDVLASGDINGDGRPDLVLGAQGAQGAGLVWYEAPAWQPHDVGAGEFTTDGQTADIDADGDLDIVVGDERRGLRWYENANAGLGPWRDHAIGDGYVHDIAIGDLDGNGAPDVVTTDKSALTLWQQTDGAWTRRELLRAPGEGVHVADLDRDGDLDILFGSSWLKNPGDPGARWHGASIAGDWPNDTRVRTADIDADGRPDVVLTASEGLGRIAWFSLPDAAAGKWVEHRIADHDLEGAHSLAVADVDGDGDPDVITAEMHTSRAKRVLLYINDGAAAWREQTLSTTGSHNLVVADFDGDGDQDVVGKNYGGPGRTLELWENLTRDTLGRFPAARPLLGPGWAYEAVDDARPDDQKEKMGLVVGDLNGDGETDIVAGSMAYLRGRDHRAWRRVRLGVNIDALFAVDVDTDERADVIASRGVELLWLEATDGTAEMWTERVVATVPEGRTQGYIAAQLEAGGHPELVFTRATNLFYLRVPSDPQATQSWDLVRVSGATSEEGVAASDVDRDGDLDLIALGPSGKELQWFANPGSGGAWPSHQIWRSERFLDRIAAADVNGDGHDDLVVTEETPDWTYNASLYWLEAPPDPRSAWRVHRVTTLRSINSLDIFDMDDDRDPDIVVAEHTDMRRPAGAANNLTVIFENDTNGTRWRPHPIEVGPHSSHLGARIVSMPQDGSIEIASIGWEQYRVLHLWRAPVSK